MARSLKIGLSARFLHPRPGATGTLRKTVQYLEQSMANWVMSRDVLVLMIPSINQDGVLHRSNMRLRDYARELDGLVLQGGADLSPESYGEEPLKPEWAGDRMRDDYEIELFNEFVEAGKPVLGVCRGIQLINVALGGTLYQDLPSQVGAQTVHRNREIYDGNVHEIRIEPGSGLARSYPHVQSALVNSLHHQAVRKPGRDLVVEARSAPDDVIEAVRLKGRGYVFGVQWHPEFHRPDDARLLDSAPILEEFLAEARRRI
ncbi:MAG: type 1 glutamine amidotransferase [Burkholderiales bacterium]|nr:type 1 glutamine amidotransferase [Burkholderiales bacterium]